MNAVTRRVENGALNQTVTLTLTVTLTYLLSRLLHLSIKPSRNQVQTARGTDRSKRMNTRNETPGASAGETKRECGEAFYGWAPKGVWAVDYSVLRICDEPLGHRGSHDWSGPPNDIPTEEDQS